MERSVRLVCPKNNACSAWRFVHEANERIARASQRYQSALKQSVECVAPATCGTRTYNLVFLQPRAPPSFCRTLQVCVNMATTPGDCKRDIGSRLRTRRTTLFRGLAAGLEFAGWGEPGMESSCHDPSKIEVRERELVHTLLGMFCEMPWRRWQLK